MRQVNSNPKLTSNLDFPALTQVDGQRRNVPTVKRSSDLSSTGEQTERGLDDVIGTIEAQVAPMQAQIASTQAQIETLRRVKQELVELKAENARLKARL